jgi:hypothetical protein
MKYQPKKSIWRRIKQGACGLVALLASGCGAVSVRTGGMTYDNETADWTNGVAATFRLPKSDVSLGVTVDHTLHEIEDYDINVDNLEIAGEVACELYGNPKVGGVELVFGYGVNAAMATLPDGTDANSKTEFTRAGARGTLGIGRYKLLGGADYIRFLGESNPKEGLRFYLGAEF